MELTSALYTARSVIISLRGFTQPWLTGQSRDDYNLMTKRMVTAIKVAIILIESISDPEIEEIWEQICSKIRIEDAKPPDQKV